LKRKNKPLPLPWVAYFFMFKYDKIATAICATIRSKIAISNKVIRPHLLSEAWPNTTRNLLVLIIPQFNLLSTVCPQLINIFLVVINSSDGYQQNTSSCQQIAKNYQQNINNYQQFTDNYQQLASSYQQLVNSFYLEKLDHYF